MAETTDQYRNRISQIKTSIEKEPEIVKMRRDIAEGISKTGNRQADIEGRQDTLEEDFVKVQQDASSVSPSGAEVAVARGDYSTLDERLTEEQNKVNAQLAQKVSQINNDAEKAYINSRIDALTSGFKETFPTFAALVAKYPNGSTGNYVVIEDDNWYFWLESSGWTSGGKFPAASLASESIGNRQLARNAVSEEKVTFIDKSNNLVNKDLMRSGFYLSAANSKLAYLANDNMIAFLIRVNPNTDYFVTTSDFLYYFYDSADNSLGFGGNSTTTVNNFNVLTPPNATWMGINVRKDNPNIDTLIVSEGSVLPTAMSPTKLNNKIRIDKTQIIKNTQLFNPDSVVESSYAFTPSTIDVEYGDVIINNIGFKTGTAGAKPYTFLNSKGSVIEEKLYGTNVAIPNSITAPVNAKKLRINIFKSLPGFTFTANDAKNVMVFKGTYMPSYYIPFGFEIDDFTFSPKFTDMLRFRMEQKLIRRVITVKKDGTGDFTTLKDALEAATENTLIELYKGTYELQLEYTPAQWQNPDFYGYMTKKGVDIVGVGDYGTVVVRGDLPVGTDDVHVTRVSTLHVVDAEFHIENIVFFGGNVRYALHDDDARTVGDFKFERCGFIKEANKGKYPTALGGGWFDKKANKHFKLCHFESLWDNMYKDHCAFSYHSRVNMTKPHKVVFEDCSAKVKGQGSHFRFGGMKGTKGVNSTIEFIGSRFNRLYFYEEGYSALGVDVDVFGRNNDPSMEIAFNINEGMREPLIDFVEGFEMTDYNSNWTN